MKKIVRTSVFIALVMATTLLPAQSPNPKTVGIIPTSEEEDAATEASDADAAIIQRAMNPNWGENPELGF